MGVVQLEVILHIIVRLVVIIADIACFVMVFSGPIIATVHFVHLIIDSVPGYSAALITHEPCQFEGIASPHPADGGQGRLGPDESIADVAVGRVPGIDEIGIESRPRDARSGGHDGGQRIP